MDKLKELLSSFISSGGIPDDYESLLGDAFTADSEPLNGKISQLEEMLTGKDGEIAELGNKIMEMAAHNYDLMKQIPTDTSAENSDSDNTDNSDETTTIDDLFENGLR